MNTQPLEILAPEAPRQIRPLGPGDRELLDDLMDAMSTQSRYQRFHSPKPRLTAADHAYLTDHDGHDRIALIALSPGGEPLAAAHAARLHDDPVTAEIGVAVADAHQRMGLGAELTRRLARRAASAGIERLVAHVLAETGLAIGMARNGWDVIGRDGPIVTLETSAWRLAT
jgi:GNAT superfamily N-acetyltransferase